MGRSRKGKRIGGVLAAPTDGEPSSPEFAEVVGGLAMEEEDEQENAWEEVESRAELVRSATERHAELWREVRACLRERDCWNGKLRELHREANENTSLEKQLESKTLRGSAALSKSRECFAQGRAYAATYRRAKKLDSQLLK